MVLNTQLPSEVVIASHLFRRKNAFIAGDFMGISDIDDPKNGLLLFKPIEKAFDDFRLSFILIDGQFRLKITDPALNNVYLIEMLDRSQMSILYGEKPLPVGWRESTDPIFAPCGFNILTKFSDLDDRPIVFSNVNRPYYRCLNLQARLAQVAVADKGWGARLDFEDFWSDGVDLAEKLKFLRF
jgi:hypothetical protein